MANWEYFANLKPAKDGYHRYQFSRLHLMAFILASSLIGTVVYLSHAAPNPNLPGDLNNDNKVNGADLAFLASVWKTNNTPADLNVDSTVNIADLSILLAHYGQTYSGGSSPSGVNMPTGDVTSGGHTWHQIIGEDFTKTAVLGSWDDAGTLTSCPSNAYAVVYTGATGTKWAAYPKCYKDTYQKRAYRSDQVLSVHDGTLDFWLHTVNGHPAGANPVPYYPSGSIYQTYGRYEARFKTTTNALEEYYQAWLLWPNGAVSGGGGCAESDFPESALNLTTVSFFAHYCDSTGNHQSSVSKTADRTQWHTYTQEWMPGKRNYYLDGTLIGSSTSSVYTNEERWQMQTETKSTCDQVKPITCHDDGHLLVDWVVIYSY